MFHCMDIPHFVHSSVMNTWATSTFWLVNNAAMNMDIQISVRVPAFSSFGYKPNIGMVRVIWYANI